MNRVVVYNAVWAALAECDVLARVTNERTVEVLRHHLLTIHAETTRPVDSELSDNNEPKGN